jgi:hypothetical protein
MRCLVRGGGYFGRYEHDGRLEPQERDSQHTRPDRRLDESPF